MGQGLSIAHRVAARFQLRRAGLFEGPPALYREVREWMVSTYAGHVLAKAEARMPHFIGRQQVADGALDQIAGFERQLPQLVQRDKKFRLSLKEPIVWAVTAEPQDSYRRPDGTYTNTWYLVITPMGGRSKIKRVVSQETMVSAIEQMFERLRARLETEKANPGMLEGLPPDTKIPALVRTKSRYVDLVRLIRAARKLTNRAKAYKSKAVQKFDVDLTGWSAISSDFPADEVLGDFDSITCVLGFTPHRRRAGQWDSFERVLEVDVHPKLPADPETFEVEVTRLEETLIHEMAHVGQSILARGKIPGAGMPSRDIRTPGHELSGFPKGRPGKRLEHQLRDVEFYPNLGDSVREFLRAVKGVPPNLRQDAMRRWVAEPISQESAKVLNQLRLQPHHMFRKLLGTPKWRKAVIEFYKAVGNQI